ncbi:hypothetical protein U9M48_001448 [Paspalum notatum var. saurae]|uniref:Uncharacterized protein n=1 Tax=Paspalum notatum var. saurae TaxID=547442 RepID=A0AAQ3PNT8_PASNO
MSGATPADKPPEPSTATGKTTKQKMKKVRMTQEEIESLIRYQTVHMPVDALPRMSKEFLALAAQHDQSHLTVPLDQMDDYVADICRDINRREAKFMKQRERILNDYYTKGYAYFDEEGDGGDDDQGVAAAPPPPPPGGRRRSRPGVVKQKGGQIKKLS